MTTVIPITLVAGLDSSRHLASKSSGFTAPGDIKSSMKPSVSTSQLEVKTPTTKSPSSVTNTSVAKASTPGKPTLLSATTKPATSTRPVTSNPATGNTATSIQPLLPPNTINKGSGNTGAPIITAPSRPVGIVDPKNASTTTSSGTKPPTNLPKIANSSKETSSEAVSNSLPATNLVKPVTETPLPGITAASVAEGTKTAVTAAVGLADALVKITESGKKIHSTVMGKQSDAPDLASLPALNGNKADAALGTVPVPRPNAASFAVPTNMTTKPTTPATQISMCPGAPLLQSMPPTCMTSSTQIIAENSAQCSSRAGYNAHTGHEVQYDHQHDQWRSSDDHDNHLGQQGVGPDPEEQDNSHQHTDQRPDNEEQQDSATYLSGEDHEHIDHSAERLPAEDGGSHADLDMQDEKNGELDHDSPEECGDQLNGGELEYTQDDEQPEEDLEDQHAITAHGGEYIHEQHEPTGPGDDTLYVQGEEVYGAWEEGQQEVEYERADNVMEGDLGHQDGVSYEVIEEAQEGDIPYDGNEPEGYEAYDAAEESQEIEIDEHGAHDLEEDTVNENEELNISEEDHGIDDVDNEYDGMEGDDFAYE